MQRLLALSAALAMAIGVAGCDTPQGQNAAGGAILGGATGALLVAAITGKPGRALVGGAVAAATGATIGAASTPPPGYYGPGPYGPGPGPGPGPGYAGPGPGPGYDGPPPRCADFYYDPNGNRVCRAYY